MNIPKTVYIAGVPHEVMTATDVAININPQLSASYELEMQRITLLDTEKEMKEINFLHECAHGMLYAIGIEKHKERIVEGLARQLWLFITQNPQMFADNDDQKDE